MIGVTATLRTGRPPSYAEAKKMKCLALPAYGCLRVSFKVLLLFSSSYPFPFFFQPPPPLLLKCSVEASHHHFPLLPHYHILKIYTLHLNMKLERPLLY